MIQSMIINVLVILVMGLAVYYAAKLNRSLTSARDGRAELVQLITNLTDAQGRADVAIRNMKNTAAEYELGLQKQIAISRGLIEELSMINETSNTIANRLERLAPLARGEAPLSRAPQVEEPLRAPAPLRAERPITSGESRTSASWLDEGGSKRSAAPAAPSKPSSGPATRGAAYEAAPASAAPERAVASNASTPGTRPASSPSGSAPRGEAGNGDNDRAPQSRAERELFAAIETLRKGRST